MLKIITENLFMGSNKTISAALVLHLVWNLATAPLNSQWPQNTLSYITATHEAWFISPLSFSPRSLITPPHPPYDSFCALCSLMRRQVSCWLQASFSLVPFHQGVQLRRIGTSRDPAAPNAAEQHVHALQNGHHHGRGLRLCRWWWQRLRKEVVTVLQEEKLHHVSPHSCLM